MMLVWDFSSTLPLALIPIPSVLIFRAKETTFAGVLSLDIAAIELFFEMASPQEILASWLTSIDH